MLVPEVCRYQVQQPEHTDLLIRNILLPIMQGKNVPHIVALLLHDSVAQLHHSTCRS